MTPSGGQSVANLTGFFFSASLQVLKPLSENYMEDNVRQTVVNSIKASLTEQVSQRAKLKTH